MADFLTAPFDLNGAVAAPTEAGGFLVSGMCRGLGRHRYAACLPWEEIDEAFSGDIVDASTVAYYRND